MISLADIFTDILMISFTEDVYTVSEGEDSVEVCIELEGDLALPEMVQATISATELNSLPSSATGTLSDLTTGALVS